ncbi:hypothetical protein K438DRAFT_1835179 [Mycena galopus ATCC 62051]|nr:hypothetical protein K438DRAFT_1835179 [Mycena galopus ATCC 62051]
MLNQLENQAGIYTTPGWKKDILAPQMDCPILAICLVTLIICTVHYLRSSRNLVRLIPGPKSPSWIYGNIPQLLLSREYGENEFQWQERYGQVYSIKGYFGASSAPSLILAHSSCTTIPRSLV